jgi:hypothetical protein
MSILKNKAIRKKAAKKERELVAKRNQNPFWNVQEAISKILEHEKSVVVKTTRAGFTTSLVRACEDSNKSICILVPHNSIIDETLDKSIGTSSVVRFRANSHCEHNRQLIEEYPALKKIPLSITEDCTRCHFASGCEIQNNLRVKHPKRIELTYAKLEALCLSTGLIALKPLESIIKNTDILFLDEAHVIDNTVRASLPIYKVFEIPKKYKTLNIFNSMLLELRDSHADIIMEIVSEAGENPSSKHLARKIEISDVPDWKLSIAAFSELKDYIMSGCDTSVVTQLLDMIIIMSCKDKYISCMSTHEGTEKEIFISGASSISQLAVSDFVQKFLRSNPGKKVIATSGTTVESPRLLDILGPDTTHFMLPDFMKSTQRMTMIPSKWKLTGMDFDEKLPRIIEEIKGIVRFENQPVFILAPNSRKAELINNKLIEDSEFWIKYQDSINIQYYRSSSTTGVKNNARVAIAVGFAETPSNACDIGAEGDTDEKRLVDSRAKRLQEVDAATWQAMSRVKDPLGKKASRVYCIGCRLYQVKRVVLWGLGRRPVLRKIKTGTISGGEPYRSPEFDIHVDYPLPLPAIRTEAKSPIEKQSSRRKVDQYIAWIGNPWQNLDCDQLIISKKNTTDNNSGYIIISQNQDKTSIYSIEEMHQNWENINLKGINLWEVHVWLEQFICRKDCYAVQNPNGAGYTKYNHPISPKVLADHLRGEKTIAVFADPNLTAAPIRF